MKVLTRLLMVIGLLSAVVLPTASFAASALAPSDPDLLAPAVDGQFVIKFKHGTPKQVREEVVKAHGGYIFDRITDLDIEAGEFSALKGKRDPRAVRALITALQGNLHVEYVEPNYIYTASWVPNDPRRTDQYAWGRIQAYDAWDIERGNTTTVIAIVDTGIQQNHPDLDAKMVAGWDFVDGDAVPDDGHGHGTHVAGTAAAETNNGVGGAGMCPGCLLMPVRVLGNDGRGTTANIANGITFAANNGVRVINLSLGGTTDSQALKDAVNNAWTRGGFLACAAGNSGDTTQHFPAAYDTCFAVANTNSSDGIASTSTRGDWVDVAAPGSSIYSTWINSGYNTISGTSMAAPHVSGLAGLLASKNFTNRQIWSQICNTSDRISGTGTHWRCGRINAYRAAVGLAIDINCESGESQFVCDAYVAGGEPPYTYKWEALRYAVIKDGSDSNSIWGACTGGTYARVRLTVRDSIGIENTKDWSFYCSKGPWQ